MKTLLLLTMFAAQPDFSGFAGAAAHVEKPIEKFPERSPTQRAVRVLFLGTEYCGPCIVLKAKLQPEFAALRAVGWRIGESESDHLQIINIENGLQYSKYVIGAKLPQLIAVNKAGDVLRTLDTSDIASINRWSIGWLLNGYDSRLIGATNSSTARMQTQAQKQAISHIARIYYCPTCSR